MTYIESDDPLTWKGALLALAMFMSSNLFNVLIQRFLYHGYNAGMNLRTPITLNGFAGQLAVLPLISVPVGTDMTSPAVN